MVDQMWNRTSYGPINPEWWRNRAHWTRQRLTELGVVDPPGNRFRMYCDLLEREAAGTERVRADDHEKLALIAEAHRTALSLLIAARAVARPAPEIVALFEAALGGQILPSPNDPARNREFELTTAGLLTMGNVGISLGEPDLVAAYPGGEVGLAAKRITSAIKLRRRIARGVDQLRRHGRRGFVVVNLDSQLAEVAGATDVARASEAVFAEAERCAEEVYRSRTDPSHFLGIIGIGFQVRWDFERQPAESGIELFLRCHVVRPNRADEESAQRFWVHLSRAIDDRMPAL